MSEWKCKVVALVEYEFDISNCTAYIQEEMLTEKCTDGNIIDWSMKAYNINEKLQDNEVKNNDN